MMQRRPTTFGTALRNQLWFVSRDKRRTVWIAAVLGLFVLLSAMFAVRIPVLHGRGIEGGGMTLRFEWFSETDFGMPDAPGLLAVFLGFVIVLFVALLRPFSIWATDPPRARHYHWLLPITRWKHDFARLVAGSAMLAAAMGMIALAAVTGLAVAGRMGALQALTPFALINFVSAPLTLYLLASAAAIGSNRPGRTILMAWFGVTAPYIFFGFLDVRSIYAVFHAIAGGPYSYGTALAGGFLGSISQSSNHPSGTTWMLAAMLWLSVALGAVGFALFRRREA